MKKKLIALIAVSILLLPCAFVFAEDAETGNTPDAAGKLDNLNDQVDPDKQEDLSGSYKAPEVKDSANTQTTTKSSSDISGTYPQSNLNSNTVDVRDPFASKKGEAPVTAEKQTVSGTPPKLDEKAGATYRLTDGSVDTTSFDEDKKTAYATLKQGIKNRSKADLEKALDMYKKLVFADTQQTGKFQYFLGRCNEELYYITKDKNLKEEAKKYFTNSVETLKKTPDPTKCVSLQDALDKKDAVSDAGSTAGQGGEGGGEFGGMWPVSNRVTSEFGPRRSPTKGASSNHKGMDFGCPRGTPIKAVGKGKVVFAGWNNGYGNNIVIEHNVGGRKLYTRYAHLTSTCPVGTSVNRGQVIPGAKTGNTGVGTGPHLHFEIRVGNMWGQAVNPRRYLAVVNKQD